MNRKHCQDSEHDAQDRVAGLDGPASPDEQDEEIIRDAQAQDQNAQILHAIERLVASDLRTRAGPRGGLLQDSLQNIYGYEQIGGCGKTAYCRMVVDVQVTVFRLPQDQAER